MKETDLRKRRIISLIIIILLITTILISGCFGGNKEERTRFMNSYYNLYLNPNNLTSNTIIIKIPFPTNSSKYGSFLEFDDYPRDYNINYNTENSPYGKTIQLNINCKNFHYEYDDYIYWTYEKAISKNSFSTQDANEIWIYLNSSNYNQKIHFFLWKTDFWDTKDFSYNQADYNGVMKKSFPKEIMSTDEWWNIVEGNTIELKEGWHKYPLILSTYYDYLGDS